jgi:hypothetical protein
MRMDLGQTQPNNPILRKLHQAEDFSVCVNTNSLLTLFEQSRIPEES